MRSIHAKDRFGKTIEKSSEWWAFEWNAHWTMYTSVAVVRYASIIWMWSHKRGGKKKPLREIFFSSFFRRTVVVSRDVGECY